MDLALYSPCAYPLIKQRFTRAKLATHLHVRDTLSSFDEQSLSRTINSDRRIWLQEKASSFSSIGRLKKGSVCCKKQSDGQTSNPSKSNQEEIISLLKRIQTSISKGKSLGVPEKKKNLDDSYENKPLTKAILDVLEKSRMNTQGDTSGKEQPKRQVELTRPPSGSRAKVPVTKSDKASEEITEKQAKPPSIETMKLAELKEVAKNKGIKGYSKLKKNELLNLIKSS